MVLAGLRPDIVLDISARALAFWSYQVMNLFVCMHMNTIRACHSLLTVCQYACLLLFCKTLSSTVSCKQVHQERMYQEYSLSRAESQLKQMEKVLTQQNQSRELELTAMRGEIASLKKVSHNS